MRSKDGVERGLITSVVAQRAVTVDDLYKADWRSDLNTNAIRAVKRYDLVGMQAE